MFFHILCHTLGTSNGEKMSSTHSGGASPLPCPNHWATSPVLLTDLDKFDKTEDAAVDLDGDTLMLEDEEKMMFRSMPSSRFLTRRLGGILKKTSFLVMLWVMETTQRWAIN
jgi:hypothetical protein